MIAFCRYINIEYGLLMTNIKIKEFFGSLKLQFLTYFLLFSYIPLIIFSIIGFFVNKSVINDIHKSYLEEINQLERQSIERFFQNHKQEVNRLIEASDGLSMQQLMKKIAEANGQGAVIVLSAEGAQSSSGKISDYLIRCLQQTNGRCVDEKNGKIYIGTTIEKDRKVFIPLNIDEIQKLLRTVSKKYYHEVHILGENGSIIITEKKVFPEGQSLPARYKDFLKTSTQMQDGWSLVTYRTSANIYDKLFTFLKEIFIANLIIGVLLFIAAFFLADKIVNRPCF